MLKVRLQKATEQPITNLSHGVEQSMHLSPLHTGFLCDMRATWKVRQRILEYRREM